MRFVMDSHPLFKRDPKIFGHFLEHFHRQIYGGIFQPGHPLSDEDGFRKDVLAALRRIRTPIIRWPGGCFVSSYHWEKGVGQRVPAFDKAWRVEDDNSFGTDEFVLLCRKLGCEPYICTNAGTGDAEEMSNWVEYCNLPREGEYARRRIENGWQEPHHVRYWSIGNENYGDWEMGAKDAEEWGRLVLESAKMMKRVDPTVQLSAAALPDVHWNGKLLDYAGKRLQWISIHSYPELMMEVNNPAPYDQCMAYLEDLEAPVRQVRGLLMAYGLEKQIRIAYDEWNLRGWHHPNVQQGDGATDPADYLAPRDKNDINATYTMADAVYAACFLHMLLRNADLVGMANFAPVVNTRGAIFTHDKGIVLRTTYHVFDMYANLLGDEVMTSWAEDVPRWQVPRKGGGTAEIEAVDMVATRHRDGSMAIGAVNRHSSIAQQVLLQMPGISKVKVTTLCGHAPDDYNDIGRDGCVPQENMDAVRGVTPEGAVIILPPHSVNVVQLEMIQ